MGIIAKATVKAWVGRYPQAQTGLMAWLGAAENTAWPDLIAVRRTFPHADAVLVASGNTVTIFNIAGNKFRLVVAIKYRQQIIYTLAFMTHADYDKEQWKDRL